MQKVNFYFLDRKYGIRDRTGLKRAVERLFEKEKKKLVTLNYIFCSDEYLLEINKTYLKHNYFTDIITFDLSEERDKIIGEIYISIDRVLDNAIRLHVSKRQELCRVIFHGGLHLCGYRDKKAAEKIQMRKKEDEYLAYYLK